MPGRILPLVTDYYYHVYNRGNNKQKIFYDPTDYQRFLDLTNYYRFVDLPGSYSNLLKQKPSVQSDIFDSLMINNYKLVEIICFCLMPNHYHLLLKQNRENGISLYLSKLQNSYTRFFNKKNKRVGALLQGRFKAVKIESKEQLLHLSRYVHLNPYSSGVVKTEKELKSYLWSSLPEYLINRSGICKKEIIVSEFEKAEEYGRFVLDYREYQKDIETIKHLTNE